MNTGRWLVLGLVVTGLMVFAVCGPDEHKILETAKEWRDVARANLYTSVAVFLVAQILMIGISLPVALCTSVLAGYLFGLWVGAGVVSVGTAAGAVLAFLAARYLFFDAIHKAARTRPWLKRWLTTIDKGLHDHGAYYVVLLRMTPVIPFWMLNVCLGLTRVRLRDYWWATQLGMLPVTLVLANAGEKLAGVSSFGELLSMQVLGALCLLPLVPFVLHHTIGRLLANHEATLPEASAIANSLPPLVTKG